MTRRRLIEAINDALVEEMERDPRVVLYGEDVELSILGDVRGLHARFGSARVRNTPICEATLTGMAVGLAAAGYRPVLHMMFANFLFTGMDAIANQMAKLRLMTGGQMQLPITIVASYGAGRSSAAQHSDTPYPVLMNLGGLTTLARYRPRNLVHVVFDNESLLSVGGFPTATSTGSDLAAIASAAGVPHTATVRDLDAFHEAFETARKTRDLTTIVAKVEAVGPSGYVTDLSLLENRFEFARHLKSRLPKG